MKKMFFIVLVGIMVFSLNAIAEEKRGEGDSKGITVISPEVLKEAMAQKIEYFPTYVKWLKSCVGVVTNCLIEYTGNKVAGAPVAGSEISQCVGKKDVECEDYSFCLYDEQKLLVSGDFQANCQVDAIADILFEAGFVCKKNGNVFNVIGKCFEPAYPAKQQIKFSATKLAKIPLITEEKQLTLNVSSFLYFEKNSNVCKMTMGYEKASLSPGESEDFEKPYVGKVDVYPEYKIYFNKLTHTAGAVNPCILDYTVDKD